jgi:hypothetical protein
MRSSLNFNIRASNGVVSVVMVLEEEEAAKYGEKTYRQKVFISVCALFS